MKTEEEAYHELCAYTLAHGDSAFIHQHVVDTWAAQHADENTKPIGLTFALVGLYLHVERGVTGRNVQRAHMTMGKRKRDWPRFALPRDRGSITAADVMTASPGADRDAAIEDWCRSVWKSFESNRPLLVALLQEYGIV